MAICTIADLKAQLSFTDDIGATDDAMLSRILDAAQAFIERKLGFKIEEEFGSVGQDGLPEPIQQAVLMLAAHWYENREATGEAAREPPFGVTEIITEYREWTF